MIPETEGHEPAPEFGFGHYYCVECEHGVKFIESRGVWVHIHENEVNGL